MYDIVPPCQLIHKICIYQTPTHSLSHMEDCTYDTTTHYKVGGRGGCIPLPRANDSNSAVYFSTMITYTPSRNISILIYI